MKVSIKKIVLWASIVIVLAVFIFNPFSKVGSFTSEIETIANRCSFDEFPEQEINTSGDSITIILPIQTSNPCYDVYGEVFLEGEELTVDLKTRQVGEICAQCIGTVVSKTTISKLKKGEYKLSINSPDKSLIREVKIE